MAAKIRTIANPVEMEISIHGAKPETHDRLTCVPGSLKQVIAAVKHLRAEGIKVNLKCPVTRDNQEEVLDLERLAREIDAHIQFDVVITPRDDGDKDPLNLMATDDFLQRYWNDDAYATARKEKVPQPRRDGPGEAVCGTGRSGLAIDPYGNIYPCVQLRRKAANIKDLTDLKDMWFTSPVLIEVRKMAVDVAQRVLKQEKAGDQCGFCMGVAELQMGDATAMYPQAAKNAEFRKKAYETWEIKNGKTAGDDGGVLTKCEA
jgi:radical SAM protein with 4Fe4S-binding SPASM domain